MVAEATLGRAVQDLILAAQTLARGQATLARATMVALVVSSLRLLASLVVLAVVRKLLRQLAVHHRAALHLVDHHLAARRRVDPRLEALHLEVLLLEALLLEAPRLADPLLVARHLGARPRADHLLGGPALEIPLVPHLEGQLALHRLGALPVAAPHRARARPAALHRAAAPVEARPADPVKAHRLQAPLEAVPRVALEASNL